MKTAFSSFLLFFTLLSFRAMACDICGCAAGSSYLGVLPQFDQNLFGLRLQYSQALHPSTNFNTNDVNSQVLEDRFYTTEAWMRYYPAKRWQLFVHLPYAVHQRVETNRVTSIEGVGDIRLDLNYTLLDYGDSITTSWKNLLLLGGGVQLPTGKYQQRDDTRLMLPALFQIGRGTFHYNLNLIHTLRYRTWGLNTNLRYTFRGENELSYAFGDQFSGAVSLFYWGETSSFAYLPSLGITLDHFAQDYQYDALKPYTGGTLMHFTAGADLYVQRLLLTTFVQIPLVQDIPSVQPATNFNAGIGVSMFFEK